LYRPEPKSACTVFAAPIVVTQLAELAEMGNWSTGVFQILSAGRTEHLPITGGWAAAVETANAANAMVHTVDEENRSISRNLNREFGNWP
jgi:hypothetical protein